MDEQSVRPVWTAPRLVDLQAVSGAQGGPIIGLTESPTLNPSGGIP
jgi:hypothetical protein